MVLTIVFPLNLLFDVEVLTHIKGIYTNHREKAKLTQVNKVQKVNVTGFAKLSQIAQ